MPVRVGLFASAIGAVLFAIDGIGVSAACISNDAFCSDKYVFSKPLLNALSCKELWKLRNSIFDEHGYCFTQRVEAEAFDNSDCTVDIFSKLDLNDAERQNVSAIIEMERAKLCR